MIDDDGSLYEGNAFSLISSLKTNMMQGEYQFQLQPLRFMLSKSSLTLCMSSISLAGASVCSSFWETCRERKSYNL